MATRPWGPPSGSWRTAWTWPGTARWGEVQPPPLPSGRPPLSLSRSSDFRKWRVLSQIMKSKPGSDSTFHKPQRTRLGDAATQPPVLVSLKPPWPGSLAPMTLSDHLCQTAFSRYLSTSTTFVLTLITECYIWWILIPNQVLLSMFWRGAWAGQFFLYFVAFRLFTSTETWQWQVKCELKCFFSVPLIQWPCSLLYVYD